jgi:hypothetical protein
MDTVEDWPTFFLQLTYIDIGIRAYRNRLILKIGRNFRFDLFWMKDIAWINVIKIVSPECDAFQNI